MICKDYYAITTGFQKPEQQYALRCQQFACCDYSCVYR